MNFGSFLESVYATFVYFTGSNNIGLFPNNKGKPEIILVILLWIIYIDFIITTGLLMGSIFHKHQSFMLMEI